MFLRLLKNIYINIILINVQTYLRIPLSQNNNNITTTTTLTLRCRVSLLECFAVILDYLKPSAQRAQ
jgi:hypothetical protein